MESLEIKINHSKESSWTITVKDRYADHLTHEEAIGLVCLLVTRQNSDARCFNWMKTKEEHEEFQNNFLKKHEP